MDAEECANQEEQDKRVAFYQTFLTAWVENRMEMDKQILTLSSLAIGFLMFFHDKLGTVAEFVLWLGAGSMFIISIILILCIFRNNSSFIEFLIREDNQSSQNALEKKLQYMTSFSFGAFCGGVIFSFILAVSKTGFVITKISGG